MNLFRPLPLSHSLFFDSLVHSMCVCVGSWWQIEYIKANTHNDTEIAGSSLKSAFLGLDFLINSKKESNNNKNSSE